MRAVILAGGQGTRLRPFTEVMPKPLLPVANRSLLEWQLGWLAGHGIDEVVLSVGYRPEAFAQRVPEGRLAGVELRHAVESQPLGTGGAIRFATPRGGGSVVVCNGDVLTTLDVGELLEVHRATGAVATIGLTRVEDPSAFGVVPLDGSGRVLAFVEKPAPGEAPSDWINAGTYVLEEAVLDAVAEGRAVSVERETFPSLLAAGQRLSGVRSGAYWLDVGTPRAYLRANADALAGALGPPPEAVAPGASIAPDALVEGTSVGPGCVVGPRARVSDSVLHAGARVGAGGDVSWSIVGSGAVVGDGAVVEGDLVGPGESVPAGARRQGGLVDAGRRTG